MYVIKKSLLVYVLGFINFSLQGSVTASLNEFNQDIIVVRFTRPAYGFESCNEGCLCVLGGWKNKKPFWKFSDCTVQDKNDYAHGNFKFFPINTCSELLSIQAPHGILIVGTQEDEVCQRGIQALEFFLAFDKKHKDRYAQRQKALSCLQ